MDTLDKITAIIQPILEEQGIELVELQYNKGKRTSVRLFIWETGGVSLDRCTQISREISDLLDRKDVIAGKYFLEVSSPGLDRPLKSKRDFERQMGRTVKAVILDGEKNRSIKGKIDHVDEQGVSIQRNNGIEHVLFEEIVSAKVVVEF